MPFSQVLNRLLKEVPGCVGAGFTADDGETVQAFGPLENYVHRIHLACQRVLLDRVKHLEEEENPEHLVCILENYCWVVQPLHHGYCLVLTLDARDRLFQAIPELKKAAAIINADL